MGDVSTRDPVTVKEIAKRLDLPYPTVSGYRSRSLLPEPDWMRGGTPLWAWENLKDHELIVEIMNGFPLDVLDSIPEGVDLWSRVFDDRHEWEAAQKRWTRKERGYVSVPLKGNRRLAVTDMEEEGLDPISRDDAVIALRAGLKSGGQLRAVKDWRRPLAGGWT